MAYGLKYSTEFKSSSDANNPQLTYTMQFLFKDYTGSPISIVGAETSVIQRCSEDNPVAPIKGQSLDISIENIGGSLPISSFFSEDDDGVMVKLLQGTSIKFIGYLVQDDFYESMVDYTHPITLSATDALGLLKGVILSEAEVRRSFYASYRTNGVDTVVYMYITDTAFYPNAGNTIEIDGNSYIISTAVNETTTIGIATYNWTITLTTTTGGISQTVDYVYLTGEVNLLARNSLLSLMAVCLAQTNLTLITNIYLNLYEYTQDNTISTFEQTLLDSQLFISGETFEDCYSALSKILTAFNLTLFQANGEWNVVHWHEFRLYTSNAVPCFQYDEAWTRIGTGLFTNNFVIGPDPQLTRPIFEARQGAFRGYKFSRKTFNYNFPKYLLKNYDLLKVGALLSTYTSGIYTYKEYEATDWLYGDTVGYVTRFIRVEYETATGNETSAPRTLVVKGDPLQLSYSKSVRSMPIEISEGDRIKVSFSVKGQNSFSGTWTLQYAIELTDHVTVSYVDDLPVDNGDWIPTIGFEYNGSGTDTNDWHDVEIISSQAPYSGLLFVYLTEFYGNGDETYYKNIRFEYIPALTDTSKIIGQIHKQQQPPNKKLNADVEIVIDDSPRNGIVGTLFLQTFNNLIQSRTTYWRYPADANGWRLGELTTLEELRWKQQTRLKIEAGFIGNYQNNLPVSLLTMVQTTFNLTKNYTFGLLTIDYKRNQFSGTLWEMYDTNQAELDNTYLFTYIYETT